MLEYNSQQHYRIFVFKDIAIRVSSNIYSPLKWLEEFLSPLFTTQPTIKRLQCEVNLICDEIAYLKLLDKIELIDPEFEDVFALDNRIIRLPLFYESNNKYLLDNASGIVYKIEEENKIFSVISKNDNRSSRKALMRILREIAMNHCISLGHQLIHCAALSKNGKGILISGPKGTGKTTLLMELLHSGDYKYIANDRASVDFDRDILEVYGIPTIVNIRKNTLDMFPEFHENLIASKYDYHMNISKSDNRPTDNIQPDESGNYSINPLQFCKLLGVGQVSYAKLNAIIFPAINNKQPTIEIAELSPAEASRILPNSLFRSGAEFLNTQIFILNNGARTQESKSASDLCLEITSKVLCYKVNLGVDSYKDLSTLNTILNKTLN